MPSNCSDYPKINVAWVNDRVILNFATKLCWRNFSCQILQVKNFLRFQKILKDFWKFIKVQKGSKMFWKILKDSENIQKAGTLLGRSECGCQMSTLILLKSIKFFLKSGDAMALMAPKPTGTLKRQRTISWTQKLMAKLSAFWQLRINMLSNSLKIRHVRIKSFLDLAIQIFFSVTIFKVSLLNFSSSTVLW